MKCKKTIIKSGAGFTMIELVVVFTVISIMFAMAIAGYSAYNSSQTLATAEANIVSILQKAKSSASSQVKPSTCTGTLSGYDFSYCDASCGGSYVNTYYLNAQCGNSVSITSGKLPTGIDFTSTPSIVVFPILTGGATGGVITIENTAGNTKTITITSDGTITAD